MPPECLLSPGVPPLPPGAVHPAEGRESRMEKVDMTTMENKVHKVLLDLGIPANVKGFRYLAKAIIMSSERPELMRGLTKELYPAVADEFGDRPRRAERAMRYAIENGWRVGNKKAWSRLITSSDRVKPTIGKFISVVVVRVIMEGN